MAGPWREEILGDGQMRPYVAPSQLRQEMTSIYALRDPISNDVRYIGKTAYLPSRRLNIHLSDSREKTSHLPSAKWMRKLRRSGLKPTVETLEVVNHDGDWEERERYWITFFRESGSRLLNLTDGGEGILGRVVPAEVRRRISIANKRGSHFNYLECGKEFWRKPHEITKGDCKYCSKNCYQLSQRGKSKPVSALCTMRGIESAAAKRRSQTHCKRGHPLSGDNLFYTSECSRGCKECRKIHKAKYRSKHR